jgi:hypothetical protein
VKAYISQLTSAGAIVNCSVVIAAAKGILMHRDPGLLHHVSLDRGWAASILDRMGYVKRKSTKTARKLPEDFDEVKNTYLKRISTVVRDHNIPPALIINWDQTGMIISLFLNLSDKINYVLLSGSKMVPVSQWTMAMRGSKQVAVTGRDDKREITLLLAVSLDGNLLPPQVLYAGKTSAVHPNVEFPVGWDVWHSSNHLSNEETILIRSLLSISHPSKLN